MWLIIGTCGHSSAKGMGRLFYKNNIPAPSNCHTTVLAWAMSLHTCQLKIFRFLDIFIQKVGFRGKKWDHHHFSDVNTILTLI